MSGDWTWVQAHGSMLAIAAGAVLAVLCAVTIVTMARRVSLAPVVRGIAIPLVLLWEAQGVYGVALRLHSPRELAFAFAGVASAVLLGLASYAHKHFAKHGNLGPNGRVMWYVAVPMGVVVAANAGSLTGAGLRVLLPLLSLVMFRAPYLPDEPAGPEQQRITWRERLRRRLEVLGLLAPVDLTVSAVRAERRIRQLTSHAAGYHEGFRPLRRWHGWRFGKLALTATDEMIDEARRRFRRAQTGLASTAPDSPRSGLAASPEASPEARPEPAPEVAPGQASGLAPDLASGESPGELASMLETSPEASSRPILRRAREGDAEPALKLAASKSKRMTPDQLALHVAAMLAAYGDGAVSQARIKDDLHVGTDKARDALRIAKRDRIVTPIGSRRSSGE